MLLICEPDEFDRAVAIISRVLFDVAGIRLNLDKCAVFLPQWSDTNASDNPVIKSVKQVRGGLPALGSAYAGDYAATLGPRSIAAAQAHERLSAALLSAQRCARFSTLGLPGNHCSQHGASLRKLLRMLWLMTCACFRQQSSALWRGSLTRQWKMLLAGCYVRLRQTDGPT